MTNMTNEAFRNAAWNLALAEQEIYKLENAAAKEVAQPDSNNEYAYARLRFIMESPAAYAAHAKARAEFDRIKAEVEK